MSNELIIASTNLPDYLRTGGLGYEDAGLGAGIAPRAPSLGITTAKQFTISKEGQTMILPPDEKGVTRVRGIIIAGAQNVTKAWYAKSYVQGTKEAPDCFSNDGKTPAAGVKMPQCSNCASCPKNAFGSHPVTGRGKACGDRKMVIFVWEGLPNEMLTFNVPTMSMQNLRKFDTELANANIPMQAVIVDLTFDPAILYPVVKVSAAGFAAQEVAMEWIAKSKTQEISDLLRETDFEDYEVAPQGQANGVSQHALVDPVQPQGQQEQQQQTQAPVEQPAKRTRRTKAQIEADNAAAAAKAQGGTSQAQETVADLIQTTAPVDPAAAQIAALQAQLAALQNPALVVKEVTPQERQIRELQEQLARAQGGAIGTNGQQTAGHASGVVAQSLAPENQRVEPVNTAGGTESNVMDLINMWKNK